MQILRKQGKEKQKTGLAGIQMTIDRNGKLRNSDWWKYAILFDVFMHFRLMVTKDFEATCAFTFVTSRILAHHPYDGFVARLQEFRFLPPCRPSYKILAFALVGLAPTECTSLFWTHWTVPISLISFYFLLPAKAKIYLLYTSLFLNKRFLRNRHFKSAS